jgi:hypothetical protein
MGSCAQAEEIEPVAARVKTTNVRRSIRGMAILLEGANGTAC